MKFFAEIDFLVVSDRGDRYLSDAFSPMKNIVPSRNYSHLKVSTTVLLAIISASNNIFSWDQKHLIDIGLLRSETKKSISAKKFINKLLRSICLSRMKSWYLSKFLIGICLSKVKSRHICTLKARYTTNPDLPWPFPSPKLHFIL